MIIQSVAIYQKDVETTFLEMLMIDDNLKDRTIPWKRYKKINDIFLETKKRVCFLVDKKLSKIL